jgi:enterochelin esterase-like enzyme
MAMKKEIVTLGAVVMLVGAMLGAAPGNGTATATKQAASVPATAEDTGFYTKREGIERGKVEKAEYESKTLSATYVTGVYLPPGYDKTKKYPVLYLLHGANGNEDSWVKDENADVVLDNLYADKKAVPMIVVMPSTVAKGALPAGGRNMQAFMTASARFGEVLTKDLVPFIEGKYAVAADAEHRAVAGYSAGAAEALNTGLANVDMFAWVAGFSPPINDNKAVGGIKDAEAAAKKLRLVWISCGEQDR